MRGRDEVGRGRKERREAKERKRGRRVKEGEREAKGGRVKQGEWEAKGGGRRRGGGEGREGVGVILFDRVTRVMHDPALQSANGASRCITLLADTWRGRAKTPRAFVAPWAVAFRTVQAGASLCGCVMIYYYQSSFKTSIAHVNTSNPITNTRMI